MHPPRIAEPVRIAVEGIDRVSAEISDSAPGWLGLRVCEPAAPVARMLGRDAAVEYLRREGVYRLLGRLDSAGPVRPAFPIRFVTSTRPHLLERRDHVRAEVEAVVVLVNADGSERMLGRTCNLSAGGMLVAGLSDPPAAGRTLRFSLILPGEDEVVAGRCRVTRADGDDRVAVRFQSLHDEVVDLLTRFAYERAADERLRGRERWGVDRDS